MKTPEVEPRTETARNPYRWLAVAALMLWGSLLAALPHFANWMRSGDGTYIADADQLLYMAWSRAAVIHGAWRLTDAVHAESGPMMHPAVLFVPPALLAHALGLGTTGLAVVWRVIGGALVALGLYAALRSTVRDRRVALGVNVFLLFDAGFLFGTPLIRQLDVLRSLLIGSSRYFEDVPKIMAHLRVVPPAWVLPVWLLYLGLIVRARATGSWRVAISSGVALGVLFHVYFYFWTTALVALGLAFSIDSRGRRVYAAVLATGLVLGLPAVVTGAQVKARTPPDWFHRTDKFVTIGRFDELLIPKGPIVLWLLTTTLVFRRRHELTPLWCSVGAGLLCANQQIVTKLQIENFHWLIGMGSALSILLGALVAPIVLEYAGKARRTRWLVPLLLLQIGVGLFLRYKETVKPADTWRWVRVRDRIRGDDPRIPPGAVLAGDPDGVLLLSASSEVYPLSGKLVEYCSGTKDTELDERLVLNMFLMGLDRDKAQLEAAKPAGTSSWEAEVMRSERLARLQRDRRMVLIDRIWEDPRAYLARFGVTHVLLAADTSGSTSSSAAFPRARLDGGGRFWIVLRVAVGTGELVE